MRNRLCRLRTCRIRRGGITYTVSCLGTGACRTFPSDLMGSDRAVGRHGISISAYFSALRLSKVAAVRAAHSGKCSA